MRLLQEVTVGNFFKTKAGPIGLAFVWAEKERLSSHFVALHLQNIVALLHACRNSPCFVTRFCSLHRHLGALATLPLARQAVAQVQISRISTRKQGNTIGLPCFLAEKERFEAASRPPPSHSRRASLGDSHPSAPCFGRFRCEKTIHNRFFLLPLPVPVARVQISLITTKKRGSPCGLPHFLAEKEHCHSSTQHFLLLFLYHKP